jgi:hypothetical protein
LLVTDFSALARNAARQMHLTRRRFSLLDVRGVSIFSPSQFGDYNSETLPEKPMNQMMTSMMMPGCTTYMMMNGMPVCSCVC